MPKYTIAIILLLTTITGKAQTFFILKIILQIKPVHVKL